MCFADRALAVRVVDREHLAQLRLAIEQLLGVQDREAGRLALQQEPLGLADDRAAVGAAIDNCIDRAAGVAQSLRRDRVGRRRSSSSLLFDEGAACGSTGVRRSVPVCFSSTLTVALPGSSRAANCVDSRTGLSVAAGASISSSRSRSESSPLPLRARRFGSPALRRWIGGKALAGDRAVPFERDQIVGRGRGVVRGAEDLVLVLAERLNPRPDVRCVLGAGIVRDAALGGEERR